MQRTTFWVNDCVNYCLLVSFAMYLSSVLSKWIAYQNTTEWPNNRFATSPQRWNMAPIMEPKSLADVLFLHNIHNLWRYIFVLRLKHCKQTNKQTYASNYHSNGCTKCYWEPWVKPFSTSSIGRSKCMAINCQITAYATVEWDFMGKKHFGPLKLISLARKVNKRQIVFSLEK